MAWTDLINGQLKQFYPDKKIYAPNIRIDPFAKTIPFRPASGKTIRSYNVSTNQNMFYAGSMSYLKTLIGTNYPSNFAPGTGFDFTIGNILSGFQVDKKQILASGKSMSSGLIETIRLALGLSYGAWKTLFAIALYGSGYGELGKVKAATAYTAATAFNLTVSRETIFNVRVGQTVLLTSGVLPSSGMLAGTFLVNSKSIDPAVTTNQNTTYTGTLNLTPTGSGTTVLNSFVCLQGCQDASNNPLLPVGLAGIIPSYGQRGEDGTGTYATYLATPFMGVTRSTIGNAGTYKISPVSGCYANTSELSTTDPLAAIFLCLSRIEALGGGRGEGLRFVMNPFTLENIRTSSFTSKESLLNMVNVTKDVLMAEDKAWQTQSWEDLVLTSNSCPIGKVYITNVNDIEFRFLNNEKPMEDNSTLANEKPATSEYPNPDSGYKFSDIDMLTLSPATADTDGDTVFGTLSGYGAFIHQAPGWAGVVDIATML